MCFETLDDLLHERNGILRTSDALARGITKSQFYEYVNSAKLEKAAHGIYVSADMLTDELYLLRHSFHALFFRTRRRFICTISANMNRFP